MYSAYVLVIYKDASQCADPTHCDGSTPGTGHKLFTHQDERGDHEPPWRWPTAVHSVESGPEPTLTNPWGVQSGLQ